METSANLKHLAIILMLLIPIYALDHDASTTLLSPTLIFPTEQINATVGDDVEITCGFKGKHRRCLWQDNNGQDIQLDDITDGIYIGNYSRPNNTVDNQCGIIIKNVTREDAGSWQCKVMIPGKALTGNLTLVILEEDYDHDNATAPEGNYNNTTTAPDGNYNITTGLRDGKSFNGGNGSYPKDNETTTEKTDVTEDNSGTYTSDDSADVTTDFPFDGFGRSGDKSPQGTEHPPPPVHHLTTPSTPKKQADPHTGEGEEEDSNGLWITLILISVVIILPLVVCIFWYFCCRTGSHDIAQVEDGGRTGVEMSPIVRESGELATISEEQSASTSQLVEVHNEQEVKGHVTAEKEEVNGISNKAFEESIKNDDKSDTDQSDKCDQKDATKEENDKEVANQADDNSNVDIKEDRPENPMENSEMKNVEIIEEEVQDQQEISENKNDAILDAVQDVEESSAKKESSSESNSDSESSDVNSTDWEKVGDKELQDVFDASKGDEIIDDSGAAIEQRGDVRDDDKTNGVQYEAQAQELVSSAIDSAIQQVEGGSPAQPQIHNGDLSDEDTQKMNDVDTKK